MKRNFFKPAAYPETDLVILAGGQARRMNGINKLLQKFDDEIQLLKIHQQLKSRVSQVWISSHRQTGSRNTTKPSRSTQAWVRACQRP